ncbi:hypothetical protein PAXINDRAFT_6884 [Paxillus involutus ATCC 200175]|nr:hypothetical protein PAXINDRAFT_6884 [Paxillus involutus ATCC 200175]
MDKVETSKSDGDSNSEHDSETTDSDNDLKGIHAAIAPQPVNATPQELLWLPKDSVSVGFSLASSSSRFFVRRHSKKSHPASTSAAHAAEPEPSTSSLHATAVKTNAPRHSTSALTFQDWNESQEVKVFCHIPPQVITSPNAPSIPRPFVYENKPVQCRADGRYGYVNIYQWPQMFCEEYPWGVVYPVKGMYWETDPLVHLGWMPTYTNFIPLADTTLVVGFLSQEKCNKFNKVQDIVKNRYMLYKKSKVPKRNPRDQGKWIMLIMRNNYNHLNCFPLTWRDIITAVAEFQRSVMECFTYFDYHQMILPSVQTPACPYPEYNPYWLGAFTCDPGVAETLFRAGVPVWLIRHEDTFTRPFPVHYVGPSNYEHSLACCRFLRQDQMETWQVTPTNAAGTFTAGPLMAGPSSAGTQSALNRQAKHKQRANQKVSYPPLSNLLTEPQLIDSVTEGFKG